MPAAAQAKATRSGAGPSDAALVVSARGGEVWAMEALFRRHATLVNKLAVRLLGRDEEVDDVVQEAFTRAFATLARLENPQAFVAWICSITAHLVHASLRKRRILAALGLRRALPADMDAIVSKSAPPEVVAELRATYERIHHLHPNLRIALVLRRVEGFALEEVAAMTGASLATVKRRLAEADRQLRGDP
jgi:RNA polymerase sigma-70 factor (ECF subfamily)